jgi:hypothetical protein
MIVYFESHQNLGYIGSSRFSVFELPTFKESFSRDFYCLLIKAFNWGQAALANGQMKLLLIPQES